MWCECAFQFWLGYLEEAVLVQIKGGSVEPMRQSRRSRIKLENERRRKMVQKGKHWQGRAPRKKE